MVRRPAKSYRQTGGRREHVIIAEKALGKPLPKEAIVHHHDGSVSNNANTNLVICENQAYHLLIHARTRIVRAGGDPDKDKICCSCGKLKSRELFSNNRNLYDGREARCKRCAAIKQSMLESSW